MIKFRHAGKVSICDGFGWGDDLELIPSAYEELDKLTTKKAEIIVRDALGGFEYTRPSVTFPRLWREIHGRDYDFLEIEVELSFGGEDEDAYAFSFPLGKAIKRSFELTDSSEDITRFISELRALLESLESEYRQ